jgi:hypothetical protein
MLIIALRCYKYVAPLGLKYANGKRPRFELKNTRKKHIRWGGGLIASVLYGIFRF